jgi:hypothetical protein
MALHLAAPLLLPLNTLNLSCFSNTGAHTQSKEEQQSFAVAVFLGTHKGYIFFSSHYKINMFTRLQIGSTRTMCGHYAHTSTH